MTPEGAAALLVVVGILAALGTLTAVGERRRGARPIVVVLAGVFFPLAWIGWYTHDELQKVESSD